MDTRFLLANERTLLAWIRTALALLAAGGAVYEFSEVSGRTALAVFLAVTGIATALMGGVRYQSTSAAIQAGRTPPAARFPVILVGAVVAIGVALLIALLVA